MGMQPIELYRRELAGTKTEFVQAHPHPFLLYAGGPMRAVESADPALMTIDRFVVEKRNQSEAGKLLTSELRAKSAGEAIVTIGAHPSSDVLIDDASVSKQHAWFGKSGETWQLWDNDSVGGTRVNEVVLKPGLPQPLGSGDVITLGYVELTFLLPDAFFSLVKHLASR